MNTSSKLSKRFRWKRSTLRTGFVAAVLGASVAVLLLGVPERNPPPPLAIPQSAEDASHQAGPASSIPGRTDDPGTVEILELQRQMNDLRSDLLDEREKRIGRWHESNGTVLVVLGMVIGIGGLWGYAKFRAIAVRAELGLAATRGQAHTPWDGLQQPGPALAQLGKALNPTALLAGTGPESGDVAANRHDPGSPIADTPEQREALAQCTEAIRLDPDHPHAWIERGDLKARQGQYEGAIADYDRAIRLDPRNAGAYLNRSLAKSELGRHDEAIADLDKAMRLDPDMTFATGDL